MLEHGYTGQELKAVGYSAKGFQEADMKLEDVRNLGYSLNALKEAGYPCEAFKPLYSAEELYKVGFSVSALKFCDFKLEEIVKTDCPVSELCENN